MKRWHFLLLIFTLLVFRIAFGVSHNFDEMDERQVYRLGVQWFSEPTWPYFGADVVHTRQRIPGALQTFLVGLPLMMWQHPVAPFVLVNIFALVGLVLLAKRFQRDVADVPYTVLLLWLTTLPWTLEYATHIYNPSYLILGSVLFFIGFMDEWMASHRNARETAYSFAAMGFGLAWTMQLHLSWVLFLPMIAIVGARSAHKATGALAIAGGWLVVGWLLLPTLGERGIEVLWRSTAKHADLHFASILEVPSLLVRFFSFAAYEVYRFLGETSDVRFESMQRMPGLYVTVAVLSISNVLQLIALVDHGVRLARHGGEFARTYGWLLSILVATMAAAFGFSARPPIARNVYILLPFALWFSLPLLRRLWSHSIGRRVVYASIALSTLHHASVAADRWGRRSFWAQSPEVAEAIDQKRPELIAKPRF